MAVIRAYKTCMFTRESGALDSLVLIDLFLLNRIAVGLVSPTVPLWRGRVGFKVP